MIIQSIYRPAMLPLFCFVLNDLEVFFLTLLSTSSSRLCLFIEMNTKTERSLLCSSLASEYICVSLLLIDSVGTV